MIMGHLCSTGPFWRRERGYHFCSRNHHLQSLALLSVSVLLCLAARWRGAGGDVPPWCTQLEQLAGLCLGARGTALRWWMAVCNVHVMHLFKICSPHCRSSGRWELTCCVQHVSWQWWMALSPKCAHATGAEPVSLGQEKAETGK